MPYNPETSFDIGGSVRAGQQLLSPIQEALQKYQEDKRKSDTNQGLFDVLATQKDPGGQPYLSPEAITRWHSMNPDKQAGTISGIIGKMKNDREQVQMDRQNKLADAQAAQASAHANLLQAQGFNAWTGTGPDESLNLTPEEKAAAASAGVVPLRQSKGSFQYHEDPNSPVNMGGMTPVPVPDPRDPTKVLGLQQPNGTIRYFPKSSTLQEAIDMGYLPKPAGAAPAATKPAASPAPAPSAAGGVARVNTPADAAALAPGTRYTTPDGRTFIR